MALVALLQCSSGQGPFAPEAQWVMPLAPRSRLWVTTGCNHRWQIIWLLSLSSRNIDFKIKILSPYRLHWPSTSAAARRPFSLARSISPCSASTLLYTLLYTRFFSLVTLGWTLAREYTMPREKNKNTEKIKCQGKCNATEGLDWPSLAAFWALLLYLLPWLLPYLSSWFLSPLLSWFLLYLLPSVLLWLSLWLLPLALLWLWLLAMWPFALRPLLWLLLLLWQRTWQWVFQGWHLHQDCHVMRPHLSKLGHCNCTKLLSNG